MSLAAISDAPRDPDDFAVWAFSHMAHHRDINRRIMEEYGEAMPEFVLDPFNPLEPGTWAYQHQLMHDAMNRVLGIAGYNLQGVDWTDQESLDSFVTQNFQEHFQAATLLGI